MASSEFSSSTEAATGSDAALPTIDIEAALARLRGDLDLLLGMAQFYEEDSPGLLATIDQSATSGELFEVQRAAHTLKGLAATFDAHRVVAAARDIETSAKEGDAESLPDQIACLKEEAERLAAALAELRTTGHYD